MDRNALCAWLVVTTSSTIASCQPERFVGTVCADESCALQSEHSVCGLTEQRLRVGILGSDLESDDMCTRYTMPRDAQGTVECRVFWKFVPGEDMQTSMAPQPRCEDYDDLTPTSVELWRDGVFIFDVSVGGPTCLMRQVTREQAAAGMSGWYYLDSSPAACMNAGPALRVPTKHLFVAGWRYELAYQCASAKSLHEDGSVEDVAPDQCPQPKPTSDVSGVGDKCDLRLFLSDRARWLQLDDQCETGVCVASPLRETVCEEGKVKGTKLCSSMDARCSCRCAGTSPDDPGPFCTCADDYMCKAIITEYAASPQQSGSYCVRKDPNALVSTW